ncbi:MAG: hypothetical protein ACR2IQ_00125 [Minisyncoccia bacterium]
MNKLEKGFYSNFKYNPSVDQYKYLYYVAPYEGGYSEDADTLMMVYIRLYGTPKIWFRRESMVFDDVSARPENVTGQPTRFIKITDPELCTKLKERFYEMYPDLLP